MSLARAMRKIVGASELPEMTPEVLKQKAQKLYEVVHAQVGARELLIPEYRFIFSEGYDTNVSTLTSTMKSLREALSEGYQVFILKKVFSGDTNMSEKEKFLEGVEYLFSVATALADISPDFAVSFNSLLELISLYPNDTKFTELATKLQTYQRENEAKKDALYAALETESDTVSDTVSGSARDILAGRRGSADSDGDLEDEEEDTLRDTWDNLLAILKLEKKEIPQDILALIPDFQAIEEQGKKIEESAIQSLTTYIKAYILQNPHTVLNTLISTDIQEGIEAFDEKSDVVFRDLLAQGFATKAVA